MKVAKILWVTLCSAGLLYQVSIISRQYFAYLQSSEVTVSNSPQADSDIPALTYCVEGTDIVKIDLLNSDGICRIKDFQSSGELSKCVRTFKSRHNLTQKDWLKYTNDWNTTTFPNKPPNFLKPLFESCNFMSFTSKCATSRFTHQVRHKMGRYVTALHVQDVFNQDSKRNIRIFLHDQRSPAYDFINMTGHSIIVSKNHNNLDIKYTLYKTIKPSTTVNPCINYSEKKFFKSRDHCSTQCQAIQARKLCLKDPKRGWKFDQKATHCTDRYINRRFVFYNESDWNPVMFPEIKDCNRCPQECLTFMYQMSLAVREEPISKPPDRHLTIVIKDTDPKIEIIFTVKLSLSEYIIYIASCISLWFGFSIFHSLMDLMVKILKLMAKEESKRIKNQIFVQNNLSLNNFQANGPRIVRTACHNRPLRSPRVKFLGEVC